VFDKLHEGCADLAEAQSAAAGHVHRGEIFLRDDIHVEMEDKFARVGVHLGERFVRRFAAALELDVGA